MTKKELKEKLKEIGLSNQSIKNYLSGAWDIPLQIQNQLNTGGKKN